MLICENLCFKTFPWRWKKREREREGRVKNFSILARLKKTDMGVYESGWDIDS